MSWSANLSGHISAEQGGAETEKRLVQDLSGVLRTYDASGVFNGQYVGNVSLPIPQGEQL